jgi:UDPglucose--hexose-1-phosphate uridylyltransferase
VNEIRRNLITGEPVIFAPDRASRFGAVYPERSEGLLAAPDQNACMAAAPLIPRSARDELLCPFCPGNEHETPPELARVGGPWRVRVFDNKYPFAPRHEVIVESPRHDATFGEIDNPAEIVAMYVERYRAMESAAHVALFKNHGPMAGASLEHLHSQIAGLPFVPPRIARELVAFAASCALCAPLEHVVDESEHFVRIAPHGSAFAYEQWIVPRRHAANFSMLSDDEIGDLAIRLRDAARSMERIAASYNWLFMNFTETRTGVSAPHWYVQAMPRTTSVAGFELATGTFIDIIDPTAAARRLRV